MWRGSGRKDKRGKFGRRRRRPLINPRLRRRRGTFEEEEEEEEEEEWANKRTQSSSFFASGSCSGGGLERTGRNSLISHLGRSLLLLLPPWFLCSWYGFPKRKRIGFPGERRKWMMLNFFLSLSRNVKPNMFEKDDRAFYTFLTPRQNSILTHSV